MCKYEYIYLVLGAIMTQDDIRHIREQTEFAQTISDPKERETAFHLIAQQRDDLLLECFSKQSERIKAVVAQNVEFQHEITEIKSTLKRIEDSLCPLQRCYRSRQNEEQQKKGMMKLISVLKYLGLTSGTGAGAAIILKLFELL